MQGECKTTQMFNNQDSVRCDEYIVFACPSADVYNVTVEDRDIIGTQVVHSLAMRANECVDHEHICITSKEVTSSQDLITHIHDLEQDRCVLNQVRALI